MDGPVSRGTIQSRNATFPRAVLRVWVVPYYSLEKFQLMDTLKGTKEPLEFCREHWKVVIEELDTELDSNLGFLEKKQDV